MIRAVLFDIDNTLVDYSSAHRACIEEMLTQRGYTGAKLNEVLSDLIRQNGRGQRDRQEYAEYVARQYPALFQSGADFWNFYAPALLSKITPNNSTIELLRKLSSTYLIGIVSNGSSERQREKLKRCGLADIFPAQAVCISGAVGIAKPDPGIFMHALQILQVSACEAVFVGDDPTRDIGGAGRCGIATCWIHTDQAVDSFPPELPAPRWTINRIEQLQEILL